MTPDDLSGVPPELRQRDQWVTWRGEQRNGKNTKVPLGARTGKHASTKDPTTWSSFDGAVAAVSAGRGDGIGFVFSPADPFVGVDLDHCRDPNTGEIEKWAQDIVGRLVSYTEISPSGAGLHVIVRATLPPDGRKRGPIEMYDDGRYFTVTGQSLPGTPATIEERQAEVAAIHRETFNDRSEPIAPRADPIPGDPSDGELLDRARSAKNGAKFAALFDHGDISGYPSASEADLALCNILAFWAHRDPTRVDALFRQSALMRPKWDATHYAGGDTYGHHSVAMACEAAIRSERPFPLTDLGNAERLAARHLADLRYCHASDEWFVWDGTRWCRDRTGEVMRRAKETVRGIPEETDRLDAALIKHAHASESRARLTNMVSLAANELAIRLAELDAKPALLNTPTGVIDLLTGEVREHCRQDYLTQITAAPYDPAADPRPWNQFLDTVLPDPEIRAFFQRAIGAALLGSAEEDVVFLVHGPGATGKTTAMEAIKAALGSYARTADFETFVQRDHAGGPRPDLVRLRAARLVISSEGERGRPIDARLLKLLSGGDTIVARDLYKGESEFRPQFTLFLVTNHLPHLPTRDDAIWRRLHLIPLQQVIPTGQRDPGLKRRLQQPDVGAAVLAWAVEGAAVYRDRRLDPPPTVQREAQVARQHMTPAEIWVEETLVPDPSAWVSTEDLRQQYTAWCARRGLVPGSDKALSIVLRSITTDGRRNKKRGWRLRLRAPT